MEISESLLKLIHTGFAPLEELRSQCIESLQGIEYVSEPITYEEFFMTYLLPNRGCVLGKWCTESWRSRKEWVKEGNVPNLDFISEHFGSATCPVANCNKEQYSSHPKRDMTMKEYIEYIKKYKSENYPAESECLYLKDWHFLREFPEYKGYTVPPYFMSDWLNEFWEARADCKDDYKFVYMGAKGTWTPFHADVFRSNSWSANICGKKKWIIFPPGEEKKLLDKFGNLAFDLQSAEVSDPEKFPNSHKVCKRFEVIQEAGEAIFVPSGWHHQVINLEDTISVNQNWLNGCNIDISWNYIKLSHRAVQREIEDCKEMDGWPQQCQLILKTSSGIDFIEFYNFMFMIGDLRMKKIAGSTISQGGPLIPHAVFDLIRVKSILEDMLGLPEFKEISDETKMLFPPKHFLEKLELAISNYF